MQEKVRIYDHPVTGSLFCEREDEGHIFKVNMAAIAKSYILITILQRIANSLRQGCAKDIRLEKFMEALQELNTGLTYPALTGIRKQSIEDVEQLFGYGVIEFMEKHG